MIAAPSAWPTPQHGRQPVLHQPGEHNFLDSKHPIFGKVMEGMAVVDAMVKAKTGANDKPVKEVKIGSAKIV